MSEIIKKSDVSEKDVYGWIIESAKMAGVAVEELNKQLIESAKISKDTLNKSKSLGDYGAIKQTEQAVSELNTQYKLKLKLEAEQLNAERKLMSAQRLYNAEVERATKAEQRKAQANDNLTSSYARVNKWLQTLRKEYRDLAVVQEMGGKLDDAQAKRLQVLEGRIQKFDGALKKVDAGMGNYQRNVGNYASATNNLSFSVTQIAREMPAFANSMQTGFMAISNNLPMLFDEIMRVNKANKEMQAQGQPTQSMFKSLAGAIFSFQTMLSVGVTLLTLYGKELIDMATGAGYAEEQQKKLNEAVAEGNEYAQDVIDNLQKKQAWDKISRKEAVARVQAEIQLAREARANAKKNTEETLKELKSLSFWEYNREQRLKARLLAQQGTVRQEEETIKKLKEYLEQLKLEEYQEEKSNRQRRTRNELNKIDLSNKKEAIDLLAIEAEILGIRNKREEERLQMNLSEEVKKQIEATRQRGKIETTVIEQIMQAEYDLLKVRIESQYQQDIKNAEFSQQYELAEEKRKQALLDLEKSFTDKKKQIYQDLNTAQEEFDKNNTKLNKDQLKERFKNFKEWVDLSLNYFIEKSEQRIEQIDKEIEASQKQYDYLKELAQQGNITAQQSLAEQQKIINEANQKKLREQRRIEKLKLAESALDIYSAKVQNGDKTPLLSTIKDITLLKQFINSLPSFEVGTENTGATGRGLDGKGGFISMLHPYERVMTADQNAKVGDLSNEKLADVAFKYNSGQLVDLRGKDVVGNSYDLIPLLQEMRELKATIENKPVTNIELGEITQSVMHIVQSTTKGNTTHRKKYVIRK